MSLIEKNKIETNKFEITVKVDSETFDKAIEKAYRKNVKSINVPGFRKGKAPRKMVEKMYGEGVFFEDAINDLYPSALGDAINEAELEVVAPPEVEVTSVSAKDGFEFKAVCVVKPEINVSDYKGIEVEKTVNTVTDEDVEDRLKSMAERNSRLVDVEDRKSKNGDTVVFDFDGYVDDVAFEGGKADKFSLELGSGQFIPGFEPQLENREIGEEFDVNVTFPEEYHADELKGKEAVFKCKLHEIKEKEIPVIDDEFSVDTSEFNTLEELKNDIRTKMQEQNDKQADADFENKLIDKVIEKIEGEIPNEMVEARVDEMLRDFEYRLQSQGMNLQTYLQYTGMDISSFRQTFKEQADRQVKIRLALEKIVEIEKIEVDQKAIDDEYQKLAEAYKMEVEKIKELVPASEFEKDLAVNKAIDLVKESAKIK